MPRTKVFKSGNSQAVRIPKEFQFDVDELEIFQRGDEIVLRKPATTGAELFRVLTSFSDDFFRGGRKQAKLDKRRGL
jgi:antitoxin VapB